MNEVPEGERWWFQCFFQPLEMGMIIPTDHIFNCGLETTSHDWLPNSSEILRPEFCSSFWCARHILDTYSLEKTHASIILMCVCLNLDIPQPRPPNVHRRTSTPGLANRSSYISMGVSMAMGGTPIAGWFLVGKLPSFEMDDDLVPPRTQDTSISGLVNWSWFCPLQSGFQT